MRVINDQFAHFARQLDGSTTMQPKLGVDLTETAQIGPRPRGHCLQAACSATSGS
jgi:hypothetical protein